MFNNFINDKPLLPAEDEAVEELLNKLNLSNDYIDEVRNKLIVICNQLENKI